MAGKDPIDFRIQLLERAKNNPVGKDNDYDADRYVGALKLVREKSKRDQPIANVNHGAAAYFPHYTYIAEVLDLPPQVPPRVDYSLSKKGQSLRAILNSMTAWGNANNT